MGNAARENPRGFQFTQDQSVLFCLLANGDVQIGSDHPDHLAGGIAEDMALRFNPAFLAVGVQDSVFPLPLLAIRAQPLTDASVEPGAVLWNHPFPPALVVAGKTSSLQSKDFFRLARPEDPVVKQVPVENSHVPHLLR